MEPLAISKTVFVKIVNILPKAFIRWYWTDERLAEKIVIDLRPRNDPIEIWLDQPRFTAWLQTTNLSLFDVTLDRLELKLMLQQGSAKACYNEPIKIRNTSICSQLCIEGDMSETLANKLRDPANQKDVKGTLQGFALFKSGIRDFKVDVSLNGIYHIRLVNAPPYPV